ncbi:MAG: class I SAM-dependent methyltransferase, partial [Proteobacteria bacterium]|nr:class I SAM-dependent methyltransferase [Pseudomonadota bacterium]
MVFFCLFGVWMLSRDRVYLAALAFALAVGAKLLPLLFMPFVFRRLSWVRRVQFGLVFVASLAGLFWPLADPEAAGGFLSSLRLYFHTFEFNASLYYLLKWILPAGQHAIYAHFLAAVVAVVVLAMAFGGRQPGAKQSRSLLRQMTLSLTIFFLGATTIHPWYLAPLVAFAALTPLRFPLVWTMVIPWTYVTYRTIDYEQSTLLIIVEYLVVYGLLFYEWGLKGEGRTLEEVVYEIPLLKRLLVLSLPGRVALKLGHLVPNLGFEDQILDVGTGNGGVCRALMKEGFTVQPIDVKDISLFEEVQPIVYDGETLPFGEDSFDVSLLIT